jgi:hypothetical protein
VMFGSVISHYLAHHETDEIGSAMRWTVDVYIKLVIKRSLLSLSSSWSKQLQNNFVKEMNNDGM